MFVLSSEENKITSLNAAGQSLYIVGEICNMPTEFLIDTGAMFSVISSDIIVKLPYDIKEKFKQKSAVLTAVDGRELEAQGPVMLDLKIGDQSITTKVYATQCSDNAILGLNTLMQLNFIIKIGNSTFNAQNIKNNSIRRITTDGMYNADGLSRRPCAQCTRPDCESGKIQINTIRLKDRCTERVNLLTIGSTWTKTELASKQDDDSDIKFIKDLFVSGIKPDYKEVNAWGKERKCYFRNWERLYVDDDNVLCRWWYDNNGEKEFLQVIAPRAIRRDILQAAHDSPTGGHFAEKKTRRAISSHYWWANCIDDVKHWCQSCVTCGGRKGAPTRPAHALVQDPTGEPMQRIAIDIIGAVNPPSVSGNKYIVVVTDYLTKWTEAYATTNQTAENVASILVKEFICRYGIPIQIHSDKGAQFEGEIFKHICRLLNIRKTNTTSYHPSGDGQVERANRVIIDTLAKLTQDDQNSWDDKLPFVMAAYRSSSHSSTDYTPNFLMLGREVNCPLSLLNPPPNEKLTSWVEGLRDKFKVAHEIAVQNNKRAHISQKAQHDKRSKDFNFQDNTLVWLFDPVLQKGIGNKLNPYKWRGPHKILKHLSECVVLIEETASGKKRVVNVDRLRPYTERSDVRFPTERQDDDNVPVDNDKQDDEEATSIYLADRVTNRPQRERRHPTKFNDYV